MKKWLQKITSETRSVSTGTSGVSMAELFQNSCVFKTVWVE